jgi:hypothetical protein
MHRNRMDGRAPISHTIGQNITRRWTAHYRSIAGWPRTRAKKVLADSAQSG